jgi:hypothetical protein
MNDATAATIVLVEDGEVPAEKPGLARVVSGALLKSYLEWVVDQPPLLQITPDNEMVGQTDPAPSGPGPHPRWRCSRRDCTLATCLTTLRRAMCSII